MDIGRRTAVCPSTSDQLSQLQVSTLCAHLIISLLLYQAVGQPLPARLLKLEQSQPIQHLFLKLRPNRSQYMQSWHGKHHRFHAAQAAGVARLFLPFPLSFLCLSLLCIGCGPCWSDLDITYARLQPKYPGYKSKDWILSPAQRPSRYASTATAQSKQETENDRKTTTYSHAVKT